MDEKEMTIQVTHCEYTPILKIHSKERFLTNRKNHNTKDTFLL